MEGKRSPWFLAAGRLHHPEIRSAAVCLRGMVEPAGPTQAPALSPEFPPCQAPGLLRALNIDAPPCSRASSVDQRERLPSRQEVRPVRARDISSLSSDRQAGSPADTGPVLAGR